jgi:predicted 2-oxoglutarate/Fe(II)-dependent dioxygenase YbiX
MYNQKIIFNELECKQILSEFVGNKRVAHKIRYDGVVYDNGCSTTSHNFKWDLNNQWIFVKIKNWTDDLNFGLKWKKKPPSGTFRKYKKGDFFLKHTDLPLKNYARSKRGILILTIGIQLNSELDYTGGEFYVWDNDNKIYINKSLGNCALYTTNMPHEVTEIEEGERNSLILFITDMHATFTKSII